MSFTFTEYIKYLSPLKKISLMMVFSLFIVCCAGSSDSSAKKEAEISKTANQDPKEIDEYYLIEKSLVESPMVLAYIAADLGIAKRPIQVRDESDNGYFSSPKLTLIADSKTSGTNKKGTRNNSKSKKSDPNRKSPKPLTEMAKIDPTQIRCVFGRTCQAIGKFSNNHLNSSKAVRIGGNATRRGLNIFRPDAKKLAEAKGFVDGQFKSLAEKVPGYIETQVADSLLKSSQLKPLIKKLIWQQSTSPNIMAAVRDVAVEKALASTGAPGIVTSAAYFTFKEMLALRQKHPEASRLMAEALETVSKNPSPMGLSESVNSMVNSPKKRAHLRKAAIETPTAVAESLIHFHLLGVSLGKMVAVTEKAVVSGVKPSVLMRRLSPQKLSLSKNGTDTNEDHSLEFIMLSLHSIDDQGNYTLAVRAAKVAEKTAIEDPLELINVNLDINLH